jgi:hypothetical protein
MNSVFGGENMPGGDGTGPIGMGPLTGRHAGFCAGFKIPGYTNLFVRNRANAKGRGFRRICLIAGLLPGCVYVAYKYATRNRILK